MLVSVMLEQLVTGFEDVAVVLDQPFRVGVYLTNFALGAIAAEEPVVAKCSCVLLLRDPDALGRLLPKALEASPAARSCARSPQKSP